MSSVTAANGHDGATPMASAETRREPWPEANASVEAIGLPERAETYLIPAPAAPGRSRFPRQPLVALGAAAAISLASAACGAALYARWQRQQNTPRQRLRRTATKLANRI
jgi:hypothetical protein